MTMLLKLQHIPYALFTVLLLVIISVMWNNSIEYTENHSIPMESFYKAAKWLSNNLEGDKIALVPNHEVFYVLEPQLRDKVMGYETIFELSGVPLRANITDSEIATVRQNLREQIEKNENLKYLVHDWVGWMDMLPNCLIIDNALM